jgi:uncharacterized protein with von Willebrand factor type A (vWA) domain
MITSLLNMAKSVFPIGIKAIKYFVDSTFREKVTPVPGSALYCDLWVAVEHSGIYLDDGIISNIVVDAFAESSVQKNSAREFTSKSTMGRKIYVSCDNHGAVGHENVALHAKQSLGQRSFYGLFFKNCHQFSTNCVEKVEQQSETSLFDWQPMLLEGSWEPTLLELKKSARQRMNATKWRLWDWENDEVVQEPDWQGNQDYFSNLPLNKESIELIKHENVQINEYFEEVSDENIPDEVMVHLHSYKQLLKEISNKYDEVKGFLALFPNADFSFADLKECNDDFSHLAKVMQTNPQIKELARKMGRHYISEFKKSQAKVPEMSKSEVYGAHQSNDVMRVLPNELVNLEDDTLEILFYARLLESNLMTYELAGTTLINDEEKEENKESSGPIVACLDTSGSMQGEPLIKAKSLLLAISIILKKEHRSLHVLLFGSVGELKVFSSEENSTTNTSALLKFLQQSFGGGTDFETPLSTAFETIEITKNYTKADILMISDGDCSLSSEFKELITVKKRELDCNIYSVLCSGSRIEDEFSDEIVVL